MKTKDVRREGPEMTAGLSVGDIGAEILGLEAARVFVVGDLILDSYVDGAVGRISPEAPVPVVHVRGHRDVLGGAGNVAANIRTLGGHVTICGRLGHDAAGSRFVDLAAGFGMAATAILRSDQTPTTRKTRVLAGSQQIVRLDEENVMALGAEHEKQVVLHFERFCDQTEGQGRALVLSDYDKGVLTANVIRRLIKTAVARGVPVIVDPKKRDASLYSGCTVIKPNLAEAVVMLGERPDVASLRKDAHILGKIRAMSGARNVVLSLSGDGVVCEGQDVPEGPCHFASRALKVADVSGAGDTMVALLALGLATGLPLKRAAELGNVAAGLVCGIPGTATLTSSDLLRGYQSDGTSHSEEKIVDGQTAARLSERLRAEGHRIVFTNGCFDLLHPGHVRTLRGARQLGDFLVVGLNSDASVRRLKGPERPVQDELSRATVLASLSCVDFVVVFDEETPLELIRAVRPDCLVKGGDYKVLEEIVGAPDVMAWGGQVTTVPLVPGQSTTRMIERSGGAKKS